VQTTTSGVKGAVAIAKAAKRTLDVPVDARLLQLPAGLLRKDGSPTHSTDSSPPGTAQRRASSYFGARVRVYSVFEAPGCTGTLLDPESLPRGPVSRGYMKDWDSHPWVQFPDGRIVAYPRELIEIENTEY
jgi:hypothetical protein